MFKKIKMKYYASQKYINYLYIVVVNEIEIVILNSSFMKELK